MDAPSWAACAITCLAATFLLLLLLPGHLRRRKLKLPPGPKPWPVIGNLNLVGPLPHRSLHDLSRIYGPIMKLKVGYYNMVVCSSADMAKAVLKTYDTAFAYRPQLAAGKYTAYNYSNMVWTPYGPYFRQARKIFLAHLFAAARLQSFEYIRVEERRVLIRNLFEAKGQPVNLQDHLLDLTLNVISRIVLGKKYTEKSESSSIVSPEEFKKMIAEWFVLNGVVNMGDFGPWLDFLDLQGYIKRMKAVSKKFDRFLEHVLGEHEARRVGVEGYEAKDMVDVLLQQVDDPNLEVKIERDGVKALIEDLILGGTDTSAMSMEWAISELLKNPRINDEATRELDSVIGRERWVQEADLVNLPYINAIVKETMRLHPAAALLARFASRDCKVSGYDIPKGTRVVVSAWSIMRDPEYWDNPEKFMPERFIGNAIDVTGNDFELLPFGSGRRMCPGYSFGLKVIPTGLANIIHGFIWKLPEAMTREDLNMEEDPGLINPKKIPLVAVGEPRLPLHLY
ncbi:trimethyltridecatetraene synthase-like [Rhodamnia argentea]|uniref:Trimethyltridecatetraene synthase-like n=1 Tax=Rhodamnia argentea TaxID=178133 RepID=A0A8B8PXJ7_9MYRT|nr:trimethyltridecatetraene synthase-like [Rhodamnia argentea]